ncbi:hypothetical protein, partial [Cellulomonas chitinilytica]|uniref:hypothetical protein n=1 Tax=Cellulomonas chitinilytica TaxID=398759 RepID=UPI001944C086
MSRDMQDVELLDGDELDGHRADADAAAVHADRRRAVWRWRVVAGVLVVGAGLLGVQAFVDARERAVLAELAGVDGVVRPLGGTLEATALTSQEVDDLRLDAQPGLLAAEIRTVADGPQAIVSTRVDSGGQPRWSIPVLGLGPRPTDEAAPFTVLSRCVASADGPGTAVCLVSDGYVTYSDDGPVAAMSPVTTSEVVVVDTDHGRVVSRWATEPAHVVASLPGLVVTGFADPPAGVVTVVAHDGRTGVERWRYAVPFAEGEDVAGWVEYGSLYTAGDLVVVVSARSITLLDADGRLVRDDLGGHDLGVSYGYLWGSTLRVSSTSATGDVTTTVVAADGDPDADRVYRGDAVVTTVDDGSVPGLFLTMSAGAMSLAEQMGDEPATSGAGPGLRAYDSATGQELWRVRIPSSSAGPSTSGA